MVKARRQMSMLFISHDLAIDPGGRARLECFADDEADGGGCGLRLALHPEN